MEIAFCLDNNYVPHCATAIASVIANNRDERITFHVLSDGITKENKTKLCNWIDGYKDKTIVFHEIDKKRFDVFPVGDAYINISTYFRLAMPELIPELDKVLYFDCDIIVNGSLSELWDTDISDYAFAGVRDRINDYVRVYNRLDFPLQYGYANAGVILINLKRWRNDNVFEKAAEIARQIPQKLKNHDQDILNKLYHGNILFVDFKYNLLEHFLLREDRLFISKDYYPAIECAIAEPVVIHYCMPQKPWHSDCTNPFQQLYNKYRALTPWPEFTPTPRYKRTLQQKLLIAAKRMFSFAGLYNYNPIPSAVRENIFKIEDENNVVF